MDVGTTDAAGTVAASMEFAVGAVPVPAAATAGRAAEIARGREAGAPVDTVAAADASAAFAVAVAGRDA